MSDIVKNLSGLTRAAAEAIRKKKDSIENDPDSIINKGVDATKSAMDSLREGSQFQINDQESLLNKGIGLVKVTSDKLSDQTKIGTAVGGAFGILAAGTGGMGVAAMGGAIGLPVALVTALIGAGIGSRWGSEVEKGELVKKLESVTEARSAEGLHAKEDDDFVERIVGKEAHFAALDDAISNAKNTLCIRSGWVSKSVVNEDLFYKLKAAIDRGVTIYIETGWRRSGDKNPVETNFNLEAKDILRSLILYSHGVHSVDPITKIGRIFVGDVPTHIKEIVVDSEYYVSGSNNWLSNGAHFNKEASHIIRLPQIAREIRDETIFSVRMNLGELHQAG